MAQEIVPLQFNDGYNSASCELCGIRKAANANEKQLVPVPNQEPDKRTGKVRFRVPFPYRPMARKEQMNKAEYQNYLQSNHWKTLKIKKAKQAKRCRCCRMKPEKANFHHVRYKQIFDVTTKDIMLLCEDCHKAYHALKNENPMWSEKRLWKMTRRIKKA